jgi:hypothetical protein
MFPHVKLTQALPTYYDTAFLSASHDRPHTETAFLRLKIRALGKGADTVYGVSYQVGTGVCVSGCIDGCRRSQKPEALALDRMCEGIGVPRTRVGDSPRRARAAYRE